MKLIEVIADEDIAGTVEEIAKSNGALDFRLALKSEDGRQAMRILQRDEAVQTTLDALQRIVSAYPSARLIVIPVDATLPLPEDIKPAKRPPARPVKNSMTRW